MTSSQTSSEHHFVTLTTLSIPTLVLPTCVSLLCSFLVFIAVPRLSRETSLVTSPERNLLVSVSLFVPMSIAMYAYVFFLESHSSSDNQNHSCEMHRVVLRGLVGWIGGVATLHATAILFGAPLLNLALRTALWSAMISGLVFVPCSIVLGVSPASWLRLFVELRAKTPVERHWCLAPSLGALLGSWVGAIPIPLDWDEPWQAWPVTLVVGALIGHLFACVVTLAYASTRGAFLRPKKRQ